MAVIECHNKKQKAEIFAVSPTKADIQNEIVLYLPACSECKKPIIEIRRVDVWNRELTKVRLSGDKAKAYFNSIDVLWKPKTISVPQVKGSWYLNYNDKGQIKKCWQSHTRLGTIETDLYADLRRLVEKQDLIAV